MATKDEAAAVVTTGMPNMKVKVLAGADVTYGGEPQKPGSTFVCHGSEAVEMARLGTVDIVGVIREGA